MPQQEMTRRVSRRQLKIYAAGFWGSIGYEPQALELLLSKATCRNEVNQIMRPVLFGHTEGPFKLVDVQDAVARIGAS